MTAGRSSRLLAGRVTQVDASTLTVEYWTDPDTGEVCSIDVPLAPYVGLGSVAYVNVSPDGGLVIGEPFGGGGRAVWTYAGTVVTADPGVGGIAIRSQGNQPREFAVSETDADGFTRNLSVLAVGDNLTITDDPTAPPITGFARYVIISTPVDHGAYWTFVGERTDTSGSQSPPPIGTRLRVSYSAGSAGGGGGPYVVRFDTYQDLIDGITIGG